MKRSEMNDLVRSATETFVTSGWSLPPKPRWDVTDFGLGDWQRWGLVLVNLAEEPEYCEKLMFAKRSMTTPAHCHRRKKEDIICRKGELAIRIWATEPGVPSTDRAEIKRNGVSEHISSGSVVNLCAGERVTLFPGVYHEFWPVSEVCIIGEVSTANDDLHDNFFVDPRIGRFSVVDEDEPPIVALVSDLQRTG